MALPTRALVRGFLSMDGLDENQQPVNMTVEFQFNPGQITDRRAANYSTIEAPGLVAAAKQYGHGGDRTISFTVHIDGMHEDPQHPTIELDADGGITPELNRYRAFLYPASSSWGDSQHFWPAASFMSLYGMGPNFVSPPVCQLGLGADGVIDCIATEVTVTETMFNANFQPIRADVSLTLVELSPYDTEQPTVWAGPDEPGSQSAGLA
jgi:contractile injection system tube protein